MTSRWTAPVEGRLRAAWGLLRHHWVVVKLVITALATLVLLLYTQTLTYLAEVAAAPAAARW